MREKELIEMGSSFLEQSRNMAKRLFNSFKPLLSKEEGIIEIKPEIKAMAVKVNSPKERTVGQKYMPTLEDNYIKPKKSSRMNEEHMHSMMQSNEYLSSSVSVLSNKQQIGKSIVSALNDLQNNDAVNSLGKSRNIPVQEHMLGRDFFSNAQLFNSIKSSDVNYDERHTAANAFKKMTNDRGSYISPKELNEPLFAKKVFEILNNAHDAMMNCHKEERKKYGTKFTEKMEQRQKFEVNYFEYMVSKNVFNNANEQKKHLDAAHLAYGSFIEADMIDLSQEYKKRIQPSPTTKMQRDAVKAMPEVFESQIDIYMKQLDTQEKQEKASAFVATNLSKDRVLGNIASITQQRSLPRGLAIMDGVSDEVQARNLENVAKLGNTQGLMKDVVNDSKNTQEQIQKQVQEQRAKQKL